MQTFAQLTQTYLNIYIIFKYLFIYLTILYCIWSRAPIYYRLCRHHSWGGLHK